MTFHSNPKLIRFDSPKYARRLARALNALPDGFYVEGLRYTQASAKIAGQACPDIVVSVNLGDIKVRRPLSVFSKFTDVYSREVFASRAP